MATKITVEGKKKIEDQIQKLKERLQELRVEKNKAYELTGDTWHDNPYFNKLEADERALEFEINESENLLKNAEIIENNGRNMEEIEIGSIVKCFCSYPDFEETLILEIVGHGETDIDNGKIHYKSLVAQNILGHHLNDIIPIKLPNGSVDYKILKFYADWDEANKDN